MKKLVYFFGNGAKNTDGDASMRTLLGGKGANLAEMSRLDIPVPPGFTIVTEVCDLYYKNNCTWPDGLQTEIGLNIKKLEEATGMKFGSSENPLLVSVRSGAAQSLPGMMDTVLNLGINDAAAEGLIKKSGNARFVYDSYRRFLQMFGDVALEVDSDHFEEALEAMKKAKGATQDTELSADDLKELVPIFKGIIEKHTGKPFAEDPRDQLTIAINAVIKSWNNPRAIRYRQLNDIRGLLGTAVNIQAMVFGNMGETSGTGVCFTRNPSDGNNKFYGEYLMNAQGEDVVAGIRTPLDISTLAGTDKAAYEQLVELRKKLEKHFREMQDIEFTIQEGKLYILQTRTGKRTIFAWLRTVCDMVAEGLISEEEAITRMPAGEFNKLFAPVLDGADIKAKGCKALTKGLNASPGGASGKIYFSADEAEEAARNCEKVLLVRIETSPEDIGGMAVAEGILTSRGGMTSHAAVVARGMGCPCVSGASDLKINYATKTMIVAGQSFKQGDYLSIDGFTGQVYGGDIAVKPSEIVQVLNGDISEKESELAANYNLFMSWVDKKRRLRVRTNADTPKDAEMAVKFGAEGIGLTRTEHMFFEGDRIIAMREMIVANNEEERRKALNKLLPMQREDFEGIYKALNGLPATIRLLDPPLHEFLPHQESECAEVARQVGVSAELISQKVKELHELNPMLGFRGCRISICYPEILETQTRAILEAAINVGKQGIAAAPEIMVPLIGSVRELSICRKIILETAKAVFEEQGTKVDFKIGTMIEVPRAAITADEVAEEAEFFSFGTNDLTQMTCGFSRDDSGSFLPQYVQQGIYEYEPFEVLDQSGVGKLMQLAIEAGRKTRPNIKLGICGEHGGEPRTVGFCHKIGLDYVSCSPYRVPVARLAAAQAAIS
ncbi:MAG: pyruvate, phosphate dikinase [Planctomycetes bacterium]|nr:pyruvate, phosphate dikinase [Planctomycetota bacterium]